MYRITACCVNKGWTNALNTNLPNYYIYIERLIFELPYCLLILPAAVVAVQPL